MRHALRYQGGFERNFSRLAPGATTFEGTDGNVHQVAGWPSDCDGLRFTYMEKAGKKFCVVRVQYEDDDIVVSSELVIDPGRHTGFGQRLGPVPTVIDDDGVALALLEDLIKRNVDAPGALIGVRARFKAAAKIG